MVLITTDPIDPHGAYDMIARKSAGSVLIHHAMVKAQEGKGGVTCHIEYAVAGEAEEELRTIAKEIVGSWGIEDILLIRRNGRSASAKSYHWSPPVLTPVKTPLQHLNSESAGSRRCGVL